MIVQGREIDEFTQGYLECALWSSVRDGDDGEITDAHDFDDIHPDTLAVMIEDCAKFQRVLEIWEINLREELVTTLREASVEAYAGHDFWLTRCGHGSGFWDGDWAQPVGDQLTELAKKFGNVDLYLGDDGKIHA